MNREIKFRGKTKGKNSKWVYGNLSMGGGCPYDKNNTYIEPEKCKTLRRIEVIPESVGQYINKTDRNNKKIYENDIVELECYSRAMGKSMKTNKTKILKAVINELSFFPTVLNIIDEGFDYRDYDFDTCKIIGNTTDNKDLLK